VNTYGPQERAAVLEVLDSGRLTMGERVAKFEEQFAAYIGCKYGVMVNSGSSANLLAMSIIGLCNGDEVITPAVTWSTTVFPIIQNRAVPVFADVKIPDLTIDWHSSTGCYSANTKALFPVHLLGNPCATEILSERNIPVIEDCCEAHGAVINGRKVGSFGDISTFSFYFSHHLNTIEGGILLTNNEEHADAARTLRAHGWIRNRSDRDRIAGKYPAINADFLFYQAGYCLRPTEIEAALGLVQLPRLEGFLRDRERNAEYWLKHLPEEKLILPQPRQGVRHAWFGYPIGVRENAGLSRDQLVQHLNRNGIETRPIMSGNITKHPALEGQLVRVPYPLRNADQVDKLWFFIGNHSGIGEREREYVAEVIDEFVR